MTATFGERIAEGFDNSFAGELVHSSSSAFQKIEVYDNPRFGRMLVLDGLVQTTERDEHCYHEMLVHPSLASRPAVERVLVIGGGDGGTIRHVLMHGPSEVVMCEIDEEVVRVCRELMPAIGGSAFDDPRVRLVFGDGAAFVAEHSGAFDAVIVDGSDPVGPAAVLFSQRFYATCRDALRPDGVLVSQTGSPLFQTEEFEIAVRNLSHAFPTVEPYLGFVPTYPGVVWSYTAATQGDPVSAATPDVVAARTRARGIDTLYYSPGVHAGAFELPAFVQRIRETAAAAPVPGG